MGIANNNVEIIADICFYHICFHRYQSFSYFCTKFQRIMLSEQEQIRRNSLAELYKLGINPYPQAAFF